MAEELIISIQKISVCANKMVITMPRNMSFSMTTKQFFDRTKTVTRRMGWKFLKPGDIVCGVEKAMGLQKGEKIKRLGYIRILSIRTEPLHAITQEDCIAEGFPQKSPADFVKMICDHYGCNPWHPVQRIEFEHIAINVRRKSGRAYNGAARDAGVVTHAVPDDRYPSWKRALCGAKPGYGGNGWQEEEPNEIEVTCEKCKNKMVIIQPEV